MAALTLMLSHVFFLGSPISCPICSPFLGEECSIFPRFPVAPQKQD